MTKEIKLTQGQTALVDDDWYEYLSQWIWNAWWNKNTQSYYATRSEGNYLIHRKTIWMSRVVMSTPDDLICDHKNHNTLDNRKQNLRNVTSSQNNMNNRTRKDNVLGERCISRNKNSYLVRVYKDKKEVFSKTVKNLDDAKSLRDEMVEKIHGEFSYKGEG